MCTSCVMEDLELLYEFSSLNPQLSVYVLPSYKDTRVNYIRFKNELARFNYARLDENVFPFPHDEEKANRRFFALLIIKHF